MNNISHEYAHIRIFFFFDHQHALSLIFVSIYNIAGVQLNSLSVRTYNLQLSKALKEIKSELCDYLHCLLSLQYSF